MNNTGLNNKYIEDINKIFAQYDQVEKVVLYGSRATGTYNERSDVDLVVFGENINRHIIIQIKNELEELNVPYLIDLIDYKTIDNENLVVHINRVGVEFYKKVTSDW
ncbi:putative nucleotidyltransferase [Salinivirga cyanobacteriivorans]|uniref:Putative nucleotidyltransferase n=1 Tax=Salinivirga cyanobacteriivorans TaxID=1307839 RepID=A0A0S2I0K2_9BACT|nr:nucleotidyltransferase domain-containing protein [Salinivirga cyanobacteriivorans]ALO15751.1 putative nucleotidyltransferase [Salinivirga cyanobacteriivorans]